MAVAFRRHLYKAEARFRSQISPSELCGGQCGSESDFSLNTLVSVVNITPPVPDTHLRVADTSSTKEKLWDLEKKTR
jgi:hypothetical protein